MRQCSIVGLNTGQQSATTRVHYEIIDDYTTLHLLLH